VHGNDISKPIQSEFNRTIGRHELKSQVRTAYPGNGAPQQRKHERTMTKRFIALTTAVFSMAFLVACQTTTEEVEEAPVADTGSEFDQGETPAEPTREVASTDLRLAAAYFDYDSSEIRQDARDQLRASAEAIQATEVVVVIEGHADERGSEEYNLALGERRAEAVRRYLEALGVAESQLRIVSYGESKPAALGSDEAAWRLNRRAEFRTR